MTVFTDAPLTQIVAWIERVRALGQDPIRFQVLDPDRGPGCATGESIVCEGVTYVYRPLRAWVDLADRLEMRLATPRPTSGGRIELRLDPLPPAPPAARDPRERYGPRSPFGRLRKLEEPGFLLDLSDAITRIPLHEGARILDLGVHTGDEFALLAALTPALASTFAFVGVDHDGSALEQARRKIDHPNARFLECDVQHLPDDLGRFDLVVSVGTLQSPSIDDRQVLRDLVQRRLAPHGSLLFGFPNCRYRGGELLHGARQKNYRQPELSLLVKDLAFYKKYLQQHRRRVHITGKHYLFLTAVPA